jgi:hypothetical protein
MNCELKVQKLLHTPVLFLIFNRPDTTEKVFETIRQAKPPRLYVAGDGPRVTRPGEDRQVHLARQIATAVDWPCEVQTLFRKENLGCKSAVCSAIDWFFENEEQGIILEDDCLPHSDFFNYCQEILGCYALDERVWMVNGCNFQRGRWRGVDSYYFSQYMHIWGWASWRRAWVKRDMSISFWPEWKKSSEWKEYLPDRVERKYWSKIFDQMYRNEIDTWDYPWIASAWNSGGIAVTPNVNLVSNIGFGPNATHTISKKSEFSEMPVAAIGHLTHPKAVHVDEMADAWVFNWHFSGRNLRFPWRWFMFPVRVIGFMQRKIKSVTKFFL